MIVAIKAAIIFLMSSLGRRHIQRQRGEGEGEENKN